MIEECLLSVLFVLLAVYYYKPHLLGLEHFVNYEPKASVGENIVWTYIERPYDGSKSKTQFSHNFIEDIPYYLKICVLLMEKACRGNIKFIVLTPENICKYLSDFPIIMNITSQYSLKYRVDLLGSFILEKYGGIWLSPGTVIRKKSFFVDIFNKLKEVDLVTFGSDDSIINNCSLDSNPDNMVIAAKKQDPIISLYKNVLKRQQIKYQLPIDSLKRINDANNKDLIDTSHFNLAQDSKIGVYSLGEALRIAKKTELPFTHINFSCLYDGRKDIYNRYITVKDLLSTSEIYFANNDKLLFISVPYHELYELGDYLWFYNLSESQFYESNLNLVKFVKKGIKSLNN